MTDPITDDDLALFREAINKLNDLGQHVSMCNTDFIVRILARLDAAERRVAELEREVERLSSMDGAVATLKAVVREKTPGKCRLLSEGERCDCHLCRLDWIQFTLSGK